MEILDSEALKNVSGGGIQEAYEYLETLRIKYGAANYEGVRRVWTEEEEEKFKALLKLGTADPFPKPVNPNIPIGND